MAYATRQDMEDEFDLAELILLTDPDNIQIIDETLNYALERGATEIDCFLSKRNSLPIASIPDALSYINCDIARYYLHDNGAGEDVIRRYNDAIKKLTNYAKGLIDFGLDEGGDQTTDPNAAASGISIESFGRVFTRADNGFL